MISINNINSVSVYERKILMRSWFFRILSILSFVLLFLMNIIMFTSPRSASWANRAVAANLPYINVILINVVQAIITIFLASDFLKRDKKLDTTETIYTRPITNGEYVIGKAFGIFSIYLGMVFIVLLITLIFNSVKDDTPVVWQAYLLYPLLISVPTIIFILGLSFMAMILIKNQPLTFILLLGYIGLSLFFLKDKLFGIWDYMAFNLPLIYSDFIGFAEPLKIILHRLAYLLLGVSFIFATIIWLNRLPQVKHRNLVNIMLLVTFLMFGGLSGYYYFRLNNDAMIYRSSYKAINERLAGKTVPDIISNDLRVRQNGAGLEITSDMVISYHSDNPNDTVNLSLNPGFRILSVSADGDPLKYTREGHVLRIPLSLTDLSGDTLSLSVKYKGSPLQDICYLDVPDEKLMQSRTIMVVNIGKSYGMTSENYVLLTPEMLWYPIAGITYNSVNFLPYAPDFTRFRLEVNAKKGLTVFSQGERTGNAGGAVVFTPENDLNGLSLVIGRYEERSIKLDSLDLTLAILPGHDFFSRYFTHISDTIPDLIKEYINSYEIENVKLKYPYKRVRIVEVPVQFHAYQRNMTQIVQDVQPEMFFMPEKGSGLSTSDFSRFQFFENMNNRRLEQVRTPEEIERNIFRRFVTQTFFVENSRSMTSMRMPGMQGIQSGNIVTTRGVSFTRNPYSAFPQYYSFKTGIIAPGFPFFNAMIEAYLNEGFGTTSFMGFGGSEGITNTERANLILRDYTIEEVLNSPDNNLIPSIISQKGYFFVTSLRNKVGIDEFDNYMRDYIEKHRFTNIHLDTFRQDFIEKFNVDINPYLASVNTHGEIPSFIFGEITYLQTRDDYGPVYLVRVPVTNYGKVKGLIDISFNAGGRGGFGGGGFGFGGGEAEQRIYELDSLQTKEIQIRLYDQPRMMTINTVISENIPSSIRQFLRQPVTARIDPEEYEKILERPVTRNFENEIIVDNEDPGFTYYSKFTETKLKKYIQSRKEKKDIISYSNPNFLRAPKRWTPVVSSESYGNIRLSALITSGSKTGGQMARWKTTLPSSSLYNVYVYLPINIMRDRSMFRDRSNRDGGSRGGSSGSGQQRSGSTGGSPGGGSSGGRSGGMGDRMQGQQRFTEEGSEYTYSIISKKGQENIQFTLSEIENGWNRIGSFELPADTVVIELSNKTSGKRVVADAVKFVKVTESL